MFIIGRINKLVKDNIFFLCTNINPSMQVAWMEKGFITNNLSSIDIISFKDKEAAKEFINACVIKPITYAGAKITPDHHAIAEHIREEDYSYTKPKNTWLFGLFNLDNLSDPIETTEVCPADEMNIEYMFAIRKDTGEFLTDVTTTTNTPVWISNYNAENYVSAMLIPENKLQETVDKILSSTPTPRIKVIKIQVS